MKSATPYLAGEIAAQNKAGTRGAAAELAAVMTDSLNFSSNHDEFLAARKFSVLTSVDSVSGDVWVTPLFGKNGDLDAVSENEIVVSSDCIPIGDVLNNCPADTPLSLLAIDLYQRRRLRINGVAKSSSDRSDTNLVFGVKEYSPNCPKYINQREIIPDAQGAAPINPLAVREERNSLSESDQAFVHAMDTLWIGSYAPGVGADTNHRGGKPGFIRVTSPTTIEWPEYRGNGMFFTSGNLEVNDKAGVTLVDFDTGSLIQMTGRAEVDWQHDGSYEGATRVIKFQIEALVRVDQATTHRWQRLDYSPYNPVVAGTQSTDEHGANDFPSVVTLAKIVEETENVKTFRFLADRQIQFLPGQYATFDFKEIPGGSRSEIRTWTLSETPNSIKGDNTLDITVKRVANGLVSSWLHDHAELGMEVTLNGVQGDMTAVCVDSKSSMASVPENLLLLSAGIGITPNMAIVRGLGAFVLQDQTNITMIHVERQASGLLFQSEIARRTKSYPKFTYTNVITSEEGRLSKDKLESLLDDASQQHAYICGPTGFMQDMTEYLVALGVAPGNIFTESFDF